MAPAVQPSGLISVTLTQRLRTMAGLSGNALEIKTLLQYCLADFEARLRYRLLLACYSSLLTTLAGFGKSIPVCCESLGGTVMGPDAGRGGVGVVHKSS